MSSSSFVAVGCSSSYSTFASSFVAVVFIQLVMFIHSFFGEIFSNFIVISKIFNFLIILWTERRSTFYSM